jgi:hypothetical protein
MSNTAANTPANTAANTPAKGTPWEVYLLIEVVLWIHKGTPWEVPWGIAVY